MAEPYRRSRTWRTAAVPAVGVAAALTIGLLAGGLTAPPALTAEAQPQANADDTTGGGVASRLLHVPVVNLQPGGVQERPKISNPDADDPQAAQRGMDYFAQMNCVGCHAANGAGGMGPALSNAKFIYGSAPENIYLTILQGRPNGMPAWGGLLPDQVIWDLVAYIRGISKEPAGEWGKTTSAGGFTVEQVPAEFKSTPTPWQYTEPFTSGQPPAETAKGGPAPAAAETTPPQTPK